MLSEEPAYSLGGFSLGLFPQQLAGRSAIDTASQTPSSLADARTVDSDGQAYFEVKLDDGTALMSIIVLALSRIKWISSRALGCANWPCPHILRSQSVVSSNASRSSVHSLFLSVIALVAGLTVFSTPAVAQTPAQLDALYLAAARKLNQTLVFPSQSALIGFKSLYIGQRFPLGDKTLFWMEGREPPGRQPFFCKDEGLAVIDCTLAMNTASTYPAWLSQLATAFDQPVKLSVEFLIEQPVDRRTFNSGAIGFGRLLSIRIEQPRDSRTVPGFDRIGATQQSQATFIARGKALFEDFFQREGIPVSENRPAEDNVSRDCLALQSQTSVKRPIDLTIAERERLKQCSAQTSLRFLSGGTLGNSLKGWKWPAKDGAPANAVIAERSVDMVVQGQHALNVTEVFIHIGIDGSLGREAAYAAGEEMGYRRPDSTNIQRSPSRESPARAPGGPGIGSTVNRF